jgi:hypothetical protein
MLGRNEVRQRAIGGGLPPRRGLFGLCGIAADQTDDFHLSRQLGGELEEVLGAPAEADDAETACSRCHVSPIDDKITRPRWPMETQ